jgi:predicted nucleic acid-binding protein
MTLVVDASLMLACVLEDERSDAAVEAVAERWGAGEPLIAPFHFPVELMSGIEQAAKRGRLKLAERLGAYAAAVEPGIELVTLPLEGDRGIPPLFELVDRSGLRAYDALYLQLALARGVPLASLDGLLRKAATAEGVEVLPPLKAEVKAEARLGGAPTRSGRARRGRDN